MSETKLACCPVCGGEATLYPLYKGGYICCDNDNCCVIGPNNDPDGAKWNAMPRRKSGKAKPYTKKDVKALLRAVDMRLDLHDENVPASCFFAKYPEIFRKATHSSTEAIDELLTEALLPFREVSR